MNALPTATTVALLLAGLKIGDVILTAEQQKSVQRFCDDMALRLEYAEIDHLYRVFRKQRWQRAIYAVPILLQLVILGLSLPEANALLQNDAQKLLMPDEGARFFALAVLAFLVVLSIALLVWITKRMWQPSRRLFDWLIGGAALPSRDVHRMALIIVVLLAVRVPSDIARNYYEPFEPKQRLSSERLSPVLLTGPIEFPEPPTIHEERLLRLKTPGNLVAKLWIIDAFVTATLGTPIEMISLDVGLLALILVLAAVARSSLWFVRKVMWRIATHSRGAWAAIVVLLTGLLAIADAFLKHG